jgi:hypothetical protein
MHYESVLYKSWSEFLVYTYEPKNSGSPDKKVKRKKRKEKERKKERKKREDRKG